MEDDIDLTMLAYAAYKAVLKAKETEASRAKSEPVKEVGPMSNKK